MGNNTVTDQIESVLHFAYDTPEQVAVSYRLMAEGKPIPTDWGIIYKGPYITEGFARDVEKLHAHFSLGDMTHSVAIGVMQRGAFHEPYIRHASNNDGYDPKNMRIYKVLAGSLTCSRVTTEGRKKIVMTKSNKLLVVHDLDIFAFQAGPEGCVFAIIDFPAFDETQDLNNARDFKSPEK